MISEAQMKMGDEWAGFVADLVWPSRTVFCRRSGADQQEASPPST